LVLILAFAKSKISGALQEPVKRSRNFVKLSFNEHGDPAKKHPKSGRG
jgi:hypothetical protein